MVCYDRRMQHPANPIPSTIMKIVGFPRAVSLYKIPASSFWWCRAFISGRMYKKSTETEKKADAINFTKKWYLQLKNREFEQIPLTETTSRIFEATCLSLIKEDEDRASRGEVSKRLAKDIKLICQKDLIPYFAKYSLKDINYKAITGYVDTLKERHISSNTLKWHFTALSKILKHAVHQELLQTLPVFPTIKSESNPRDYFSEEQYELLKKTIAKCIDDGVVVRGMPITVELRMFVSFMISSFLRVSDMKTLTNKLIESKKKGKNKYLLITATTKVKEKQIVSLASAVSIYEQVQKINKLKGFNKSDDFVWFPQMPNRDYAMQQVRRQFDHVLKIVNLKMSPTGLDRNLTSLRHSAAMFAGRNREISLKVLADNLRTSIEMLDKHYLSQMTNEMHVEQIQSKRRG
jgi:hypothetical protein